MKRLENIPEPILNQIKDMGKGLDKYIVGDSVIVIYDSEKDEVAAYYSGQMKQFVPNYRYFMKLEYMGLGGDKEMEYIYNNIIIPNMDLPQDVKLKGDLTKNKKIISFIEGGFRSALEKGNARKIDNTMV